MRKVTYSKKLYIMAWVKLGVTLLILLSLLFLDFRYGFSQKSFTSKTLEILFVFILGFFSYPVFKLGKKKLDIFEDKIFNDADKAKLGFEGEDTVESWLKQILPKNEYTILSNIILPECNFDIDFIVVGPKGIILLEAKNFTSHYQFSDGECFKIKDGKKILLTRNYDPRDQVQRHVSSLTKYLESKGYSNLRILKALVFINADLISINGSTGIYIANGFDSLKRFFDNSTLDNSYTPEFCEKIKQVLI